MINPDSIPNGLPEEDFSDKIQPTKGGVLVNCRVLHETNKAVLLSCLLNNSQWTDGLWFPDSQIKFVAYRTNHKGWVRLLVYIPDWLWINR